MSCILTDLARQPTSLIVLLLIGAVILAALLARYAPDAQPFG